MKPDFYAAHPNYFIHPTMSTTLHSLVLRAIINQDTLNKRLREDWARQDWPYYRAVWTEVGEAVQHLKSWLWWKEGEFGKPPTPEALAHIQMELVDILHFGLSMQIVEMVRLTALSSSRFPMGRQMDESAEQYVKAFGISPPAKDTNPEALIAALEELTVYAIEHRTFEMRSFATACLAAGMDLEHVLAVYVAKSTLNKFRWNNGYDLPKGHPAKYVKMWPNYTAHAGLTRMVEDNEVLQDIVTGMLGAGASLVAMDSAPFEREIYDRLADLYPGPKGQEPADQL